MIFGVGVDLVDLARFERSLGRTPRLAERLFLPAERGLSVRSLAGRFAAKEALIKAFGGSDGLSWQEIEVVSDSEGAPGFALTGSALARAATLGIGPLHLSLSHDGGNAIAFVIAERTPAP